MKIIKRVTFTEEEMKSIETVYQLAEALTKRFPEFTPLEAVDLFFEVLLRNNNEVEV